jgi:hypothetical protein
MGRTEAEAVEDLKEQFAEQRSDKVVLNTVAAETIKQLEHIADGFEYEVWHDTVDDIRAAAQRVVRFQFGGNMIAWLIEYKPHPEEPNQSPRWWAGCECNIYNGGFTEDPNNAIQFMTEIQGNVVLMALTRICRQREYAHEEGWHRHLFQFGNFTVTQHEWVDLQPNAEVKRAP